MAVLAAEDLRGFEVIALAPFSLARAADSVARATGLKVLATPDCAVLKLRRLLSAQAPEQARINSEGPAQIPVR